MEHPDLCNIIMTLSNADDAFANILYKNRRHWCGCIFGRVAFTPQLVKYRQTHTRGKKKFTVPNEYNNYRLWKKIKYETNTEVLGDKYMAINITRKTNRGAWNIPKDDHAWDYKPDTNMANGWHFHAPRAITNSLETETSLEVVYLQKQRENIRYIDGLVVSFSKEMQHSTPDLRTPNCVHHRLCSHSKMKHDIYVYQNK